MAVKFYSARKKKVVFLDESKCVKVQYNVVANGKPKTTYAFKGIDDDGGKLMVFTNKKGFDESPCKAE